MEPSETSQCAFQELGYAAAETGAWWIDRWARLRVGHNSLDRTNFDNRYGSNPSYEQQRAMYVWRTFIASRPQRVHVIRIAA
jgi:hypothetical protein